MSKWNDVNIVGHPKKNGLYTLIIQAKDGTLKQYQELAREFTKEKRWGTWKNDDGELVPFESEWQVLSWKQIKSMRIYLKD